MTGHTDTCANVRTCEQECGCGRGGWYMTCRYRSCYECYRDRRALYVECILCGGWHSPEFDTCFTCRPESRGRDDAVRALRQLILWRDDHRCRYCGAADGSIQIDPRLIRPACRPTCPIRHSHWLADDDGARHTWLHVDHIVPCARGGAAVEWNLQTLCVRCNIAKGATWFPGCRHDDAKTLLCRTYFVMARSYFTPADLAAFMSDVRAYRATGTWDPRVHQDWRRRGNRDE